MEETGRTYPYHLSPGGTILTIEAGEDECPNRSDASSATGSAPTATTT